MERNHINVDFCDITFSVEGDHVRHIIIHKEERPYSCSYCDKTFLVKRYLNANAKAHNRDKPHKCSYCDQVFSNCGLARHLKRHSCEKPYNAFIVIKSFSVKSYLIKNNKRHIGKSTISAVIVI